MAYQLSINKRNKKNQKLKKKIFVKLTTEVSLGDVTCNRFFNLLHFGPFSLTKNALFHLSIYNIITDCLYGKLFNHDIS